MVDPAYDVLVLATSASLLAVVGLDSSFNLGVMIVTEDRLAALTSWNTFRALCSAFAPF